MRLEELRSGLAIVPQEPMLFGGSIAYNLDPFGDFTAQQLWHALAEVRGLKLLLHALFYEALSYSPAALARSS